jgi:hypothetical protein
MGLSKWSYVVIAIGIFLIILSVVLFLKESDEAQNFCNYMNGTYKFNLYHFCNGELIQKYQSFGKEFWSYQINFTAIKNPVLNETLLNN